MADITVLQSTDLLRDSRQVINDNFAALLAAINSIDGSNIETPVGDIDSDNLIFTVNTKPLYIIVDDNTKFENFGYSYSDGVIIIDPETPPTRYIRSITVTPLSAQALDGTNGQYKTILTVGFSDADFICDGDDDGVQIQQALDALPSTGGAIIIKGNATPYDVQTSIVIDAYQTVLGAGTGATTIRAADGLNSYVFTTATTPSASWRKIYMAHFKIDGNRGGNTSGGGIYCHNARNSTFYDLWITETDDYAINLDGDSALGWFNLVDRCEVDLCDAGFHARFCEHNWFTKNTMSFIIGKGIFCESDLDEIYDNQLDFIEDYEIHCYFGAGIWQIMRNSIDRPQSHGVVIQGADKCDASHNYFDSAPAGCASIFNVGSDQLICIGNRMTQTGGAGSYGILEGGSSDKCTYMGNIITGPTTAISVDAGSTNLIRLANQGDI